MKQTAPYKGTLRYRWDNITLPPHYEIDCDAVFEVDFTVLPPEPDSEDTPGCPEEVDWNHSRLIEVELFGEGGRGIRLGERRISKSPFLRRDFLAYWNKSGPWDKLEDLALKEASEACQQ